LPVLELVEHHLAQQARAQIKVLAFNGDSRHCYADLVSDLVMNQYDPIDAIRAYPSNLVDCYLRQLNPEGALVKT